MSKKLFPLFGLLIVGSALLAMTLFSHSVKAEGLTEYAEKILSIQLDDIVKEEDGEIKKSFLEDYAYIRLELIKGGENEFSERMEKAGKKAITEITTIPGYNGNSIAKDLKDNTVISRYDLFFSGKWHQMTRSVECYLAKNNNSYWVYLFG